MSERCELGTLCHINRSGPVFLRHSIDVEQADRRSTTLPQAPLLSVCLYSRWRRLASVPVTRGNKRMSWWVPPALNFIFSYSSDLII